VYLCKIMQDKAVMIVLLIVLSITLVFQTTNNAYGAVTTPTFTTIDVSGTFNVNDYLFGITCTDATYRYVALYSQGKLVRIDRSTNAVTFFDNNAVAAGEDWYSLVTDPVSGKIFVNERDTGRSLSFNPSTGLFTSFAVVPNIAGGVVSYVSSYNDAPHKIAIAGIGTHTFGFDSNGELKSANGYIWQPLDAVYDFSVAENAAGAVDSSFHGIVRIDPSDNTITRYAIAGATALRGISVDSSDSTILWITDILANKLFRFNTVTGLVTDTITLPASTSPRGLANDATAVYIAENQVGGAGINSKIIKVIKSDFSTSEIDTGADTESVTKRGTFSLYIVNGFLVWTDEASHVGTISISGTNIKTIMNPASDTNTNHFACIEGNNITFTGHGSAKIGFFSITNDSTTESGSGDDCAGDCYAPNLGWDHDGKFLYKDGLYINNIAYEMKNILHNQRNQTIELPVGQPVNMTLKGYDTYPDNINNCEIGIGIKKGNFVKQDATFIIGIWRSFDNHTTIYYEGDSSAYRDVNVKFTWTPTKHLINDMFAIQAIDQYNYNKITFINEGYQSVGLSLVGTPIFKVMDKYDHDKIKDIAVLDKTLVNQNIAIDENNNLWQQFDGKWQKELSMPDRTCNITKHGYDRYCNEFKAVMNNQESIARQYFDSDIIQAIMSPIIEKEPISYERLHDSIPNMIKAQTAFYQKDFNKVLKYSN
ncbi:MAG: hypothetical protein UT24_C0024G0022, partial [Candidatus Woesebacteria bacterium GW2011_GWB1_39_12]